MKSIAVVLALIAGSALAQDRTGPPPITLTAITTAASPLTDNSVSLGDLTHRWKGAFLGTDGLSNGGGITFTATGSTNTITSDTSAATATTLIAAITLRPSATLDANDLILNVENAAGVNLVTVDKEGDVSMPGSLTVTGGSGSIAASEFVGDYHKDSGGTSRLVAINADSNYITGEVADGSSAVSNKFGNVATLSTAGARIARFYNDNMSTTKADIDLNGFYLQPAQTVTVANDGAGSAPATTVTPSSRLILMAYNDVTNASVGTLVETGAQPDEEIKVVHTGSGGTVVFTEIAGQQEIGATPCTLGLSDVMTAVYANSTWIITNCRDN
jgi:hypothetical protein